MRRTSRSSLCSATVRSGATICARPISPAARERHSVVIAGSNPVIHRLCKRFLTRKMDPRVKPAGDGRTKLNFALSLGAGRGLRGLHLRALLIERDEIDRIEQERGEAAVADGVGDDLAREREQEARALDHDERLQRLRRHVLHPEYPGEGQLERKQHRAGAVRLAFELERDLVVGLGELLDDHVDLDIDRRRLVGRRQRARRVRILERQILDVLAEDVELRLARLRARALRGAAIATGGRHRLYLSPFSATVMAAWLTQGPQPDKDVTLRARPRLWACGGAAADWEGDATRRARGR